MREIKFRGKYSDESNWIYGHYFNNHDYGVNESYIINNDGQFVVSEKFIGQYIGLKDKNGVEIYESDILEFPFEMGIAFVINDGFRFAVESPGSGAIDYEKEDVYKATSVIGNIFENPELLQGVISADA